MFTDKGEQHRRKYSSGHAPARREKSGQESWSTWTWDSLLPRDTYTVLEAHTTLVHSQESEGPGQNGILIWTMEKCRRQQCAASRHSHKGSMCAVVRRRVRNPFMWVRPSYWVPGGRGWWKHGHVPEDAEWHCWETPGNHMHCCNLCPFLLPHILPTYWV